VFEEWLYKFYDLEKPNIYQLQKLLLLSRVTSGKSSFPERGMGKEAAPDEADRGYLEVCTWVIS
jgi:hypothetical protein